jgi:hypothetical protein
MYIEYADIGDILEPQPHPNVQENSKESHISDESDQRDRRLNTFWLVYK